MVNQTLKQVNKESQRDHCKRWEGFVITTMLSCDATKRKRSGTFQNKVDADEFHEEMKRRKPAMAGYSFCRNDSWIPMFSHHLLYSHTYELGAKPGHYLNIVSVVQDMQLYSGTIPYPFEPLASRLYFETGSNSYFDDKSHRTMSCSALAIIANGSRSRTAA